MLKSQNKIYNKEVFVLPVAILKNIRKKEMPFNILFRKFNFNQETEDAFQEVRDIMSGKIETKSYKSAQELFEELDAE